MEASGAPESVDPTTGAIRALVALVVALVNGRIPWGELWPFIARLAIALAAIYGLPMLGLTR